MAKNAAAQVHADIDWLERESSIREGRDPLGIEGVSINLYSFLLPGITNVTDRARYYSFYPWVLHRFAQNSSITHAELDWCQWLRELDFTYALASVAYQLSNEIRNTAATAVVGSNRALTLLQRIRQSDGIVDVHSSARIGKSGKVPTSGAYFKNPEGGFGQYYKVPLEILGLLARDGDSSKKYQLTRYAGLPVAESVEQQGAFHTLIDLAALKTARFSELATLGSQLDPSTIEPGGNEEHLLRSLFLGEDDDLCRGQQHDQRVWRRNSLTLVLCFVRDSGALKWNTFTEEFRWACTTGSLPDGKPWQVPTPLQLVTAAWAAYHRNDLLNYALECLFWAALQRMEEGNFTPQMLARRLADLACAALPSTTDSPGAPALTGTVSDWRQACQAPSENVATKTSKQATTRAWVTNLETAVANGEVPHAAGWATHLLGRLISDHGIFVSHPFEVIPQAMEMIGSLGILHLGTWLKRTADRASEPLAIFLKDVILEWILYRHLRVATRKLANQGISTFKFRPEEGRLVSLVDKAPQPTFTNPRLRQAQRILADLHYLTVKDGQVQITSDGAHITARMS